MYGHIDRDGPTIRVYSLEEVSALGQFYNHLYQASKVHRKGVVIDFAALEGAIYPNTLVPIWAAIETIRDQMCPVSIIGSNNVPYLVRSRALDPLESTAKNVNTVQSPLSVVWKVTDVGQIDFLLDSIVQETVGKIVCAQGVSIALNWILNEAIDNVFNHSEAKVAYLMVQVHSSHRRIATAVFDQGIGIYNSFANSKYHVLSPVDALTKALTPNITRDPTVGAGKGLAGMTDIIKENEGIFSLTSAGASARLEGDKFANTNNVPVLLKQKPGTLVDLQLLPGKTININERLGTTIISTYHEKLEEGGEEQGDMVLLVATQGRGTGTREAAKFLRRQSLDCLANGARRVIFDFDGIDLISTSFADEVFGRAAKAMGIVGFSQKYQIKNVKPLVRQIIDKAIVERINRPDD